MSKVLIVGAGASGMMAAIAAAGNGHDVHVYEKNEKTGKKLFITGKGRCNVTNASDMDEQFKSIVTNEKFMYSALYSFSSDMLMNFFEEIGLRLKVERGNRVFPESDKSSDVIDALKRKMKRLNVNVHLNAEIKDIIIEDDICKGLVLHNGTKIKGDAVIIATGGCSYESTGSTGDGYRFAKEAGHTIIKPRPSLVPLNIKEEYVKDLQGLSLRNVRVQITDNGKEIYSDFGEMLFTHFGVSGPLILSGSSYIKEKSDKLTLTIDLKPALSEEQLDHRILNDFEENKNKAFKNSLDKLLPKKLIPVIINNSKINLDKRVNEITKEERRNLLKALKQMTLTISGTRGFNEAIITKGGVNVKEINPATMQSKLTEGLYFAGEVIDIDALTGGYNLQLAWSSGYLAGISIV